MYEISKLIHLIAAIVWMGGMTFMIFALRPATMATTALPPAVRAQLMAQVWRRFFALVLACIAVLFITGTHLYTSGFKAFKLAGGGVPLGWNLMLVLGMLMFLVFGHIYFAGFRKFKRAVAASDWPLAAQSAGQIQTMVMLNFILGWVAIISVHLVK
jgi:uncharacterized membrane protein